jgi:hypothetical protein
VSCWIEHTQGFGAVVRTAAGLLRQSRTLLCSFALVAATTASVMANDAAVGPSDDRLDATVQVAVGATIEAEVAAAPTPAEAQAVVSPEAPASPPEAPASPPVVPASLPVAPVAAARPFDPSP